MNTSRLRLLVLWLFVSALGAGLGGVLGVLLLNGYLQTVTGRGAVNLLTVLLLMPAVGFGLGLAQSILLNYGPDALLARRRPWLIWWALAGALGWLLGLSVDFTLNRANLSQPWMAYAMGGFYSGAMQWLVLYRSKVQRAAPVAVLWVPLSTLVWTLVYPLQLAGGEQAESMGALGEAFVTWAVAGAVVGALTGWFIAWMVKYLT